MEDDYSKTLMRLCEYTPLIRLERDVDGIRLSWKETEPKEEEKWEHEVCLSPADVKALIKMFQDILAV